MISFSGLRDAIVDFVWMPSARFIDLVEHAFGPMALRREMRIVNTTRKRLLQEVTYANQTCVITFYFDLRDLDVDCRYGPASSLTEAGNIDWPDYDDFVSIDARLRRLGMNVPQGYEELIKKKRLPEAVAMLVSGLERFESEIFPSG